MTSVLITGSTSGIGLGIAKAFARMQGVNVMLNGFGTKADIDAAMAEVQQSQSAIMEQNRGKIRYNGADLMKSNEIEGMIHETVSEFGRLDVLINNAGIQHVCPVEQFPPEQWDRIIALNLTAVFHATRYTIPQMKKQKFGRIINIASVHGHVGSVNKSAYLAAKHGVIGFTKGVALELAREDITCNAVCPGWVMTPLVKKQVELRMEQTGKNFDEATIDLVGEKHPNKRMVTVEELGSACIYLALPSTKSTTGSSMMIEGGWLAQ